MELQRVGHDLTTEQQTTCVCVCVCVYAHICFLGGASGKEPSCQCRRHKDYTFRDHFYSSLLEKFLWSCRAPKKTKKVQVQFLGWEDLLEERISTHSSILAWRINWVTSSYVGFLRPSKMQFESWGKGSSCLLCFSIPLGFFRKASSSLFESKELPLGFTRDRLFQKFVYVRNFPVLQAVFLKRLVACSSVI